MCSVFSLYRAALIWIYLYLHIHSTSCKFWDSASKTIKKSSKIFLFKVIVINCNILVSAIFQPMHCSRKISNRNSLQFCCYRCLNVTYGYILVPLQLHFQLQKRKIVGRTQIRRVRAVVKSFVGTMCCSHCSLSTHAVQIVHTVFVFSNHQSECGERWFFVSQYSLLSSYN